MAEVTAFYNNCVPHPIHGLPYVVVFPILDADGDLVSGAAGLDSEVSGDGNTFNDCVNEATEIPTSSGIYYLALTAAEMGNQVVTVQVKTSTSGAKTTVLTLYPMVHCGALRAGTAAGGSANTIVLDAGASSVDQAYAGHVIAATIDGTLEVRLIYEYTGSTKTAYVHPNWVTASPDSDDAFEIYNVGLGFMTPAVFGNIQGNVQGSVASVTGAVGSVTAGVTVATNNDKTGYALARPGGAVAADANNTASSFKTNLTSSTTDQWKKAYLKFTSGNCLDQVRKITGYHGTTKVLTVDEVYTEIPAAADTFDLIVE